MRNLPMVLSVNQMWNFLNVQYLQSYLSEDVEFRTECVLLSIRGKENVLNFLTSNLNFIRDRVGEGVYGLYSWPVSIYGNIDEAFVELCFFADNEYQFLLIRIQGTNGLITSIEFIPYSDDIVTTRLTVS